MLELLFYKVVVLSLQFYQKETLTQVFSCEFLDAFKNIFFTEHFRATASLFDGFRDISTLYSISHGSSHQVMFRRMRVSKWHEKNLNNVGKKSIFNKAVS